MRAHQVPILGQRPQLAQGVVAAYDFALGTGPNVPDVSGNGNTGVWQGTPGWGQGKIGGGGVFNGTNNGIQVSNTPLLNPHTALTISVWFNAVNFAKWAGDSSKSQVIIRKDGNFILYIYDVTRGQLNIDFFVYGPNARLSYPISGVLSNSTWYHLLATYDGSFQRTYLNRIQVAQQATTGIIGTSSNPFCIGFDAGDPLSWFAGSIDEPTIWYNHALTPNEIAALYNNGQGKAYPFT